MMKFQASAPNISPGGSIVHQVHPPQSSIQSAKATIPPTRSKFTGSCPHTATCHASKEGAVMRGGLKEWLLPAALGTAFLANTGVGAPASQPIALPGSQLITNESQPANVLPGV